MPDLYNNAFMKLGMSYVEMYRKDIFKLEMINTLPTVRECILTIYNIMIAHKEIPLMESLPEEVKRNLWEFCKPYVAALNKEQRIEFAKCYYVLDHLAARSSSES